jgi:hypothetical protein
MIEKDLEDDQQILKGRLKGLDDKPIDLFLEYSNYP